MSLAPEERIVTPAALARLIQWDKVEGCVILLKGKKGETNNVVMSSISVEEMSLLKCQFDAHVTGMLLGSLEENLPNEGPADASNRTKR